MKKTIILLSIVISSLNSCVSGESGIIVFIHVGPQNKSITPILIADKEVNEKDYPYFPEKYVVIINEKDFSLIFNYLRTMHDSDKLYPELPLKYGTFQILSTKNKIDYFYYHIGARKQSLSFFIQTTEYLRQHCEDKKIVEVIEGFIINNINYAPPIGSGLEDE